MIGFDIGGTKCAVCIGEPQENRFIISDKRSFATKDARDPYEMIEWLCSAAEEMTDDLSRVGISCGGPLDTARGLILSPPNLPGWDEIPIVELVEKRLGCRAALRNDADACALAEWRYGAGRGSDSMVFLTFGTGFGAGVILNRALWQGATGRAGEEVNAYEDEVLLMPENINERMQDQESISANESENRNNNIVVENNNIVVENNNIIENNIDLENEHIVFDPDDIENSFSHKSNDSFENDDVEEIQGIVNDININEPVLDILENDNSEDEKDSFIENDNSEDEEYSFENEDNKLSDEINRFFNDQNGDGFGAQGNEEVQEVPKEYRPSAKVLFERAARPVEFKQEAIAFIRDLLKDFNVSEDLINEIYVQATEQCSDICNSYDTQVAGDDQDGIADVMGSTASSTFGLLHYTIKDSDLNIVDRLVISQKLTDYFIHKLTPIGFNPEEFGKYGENFMLNYRDAITNNVVENYEEDEISREDCENAIDDAIKALGANAPQIGEEKCNNPQNEEIENNEDAEKEEIVVNEVLEGDSGKEISVIIEDDSKSVASQKQM